MNGKGKYWYADGSFYEGQWQNGRMFGKGSFIYPNSNRYDGEFLNDMKEGYGIFQYANGECCLSYLSFVPIVVMMGTNNINLLPSPSLQTNHHHN